MADYLHDLEYMGLTPRIKRLSDRFLQEGRELYNKLDSDIEPNWFLVMKLIWEDDVTNITELTSRLGFSHPSIIAIVKKMQSRGYVKIKKNKEDKRKQEIRLTAKAKSEIPEFQKVWRSCQRALDLIFVDDSFLQQLKILEDALERRSFSQRVLNQMDNCEIEYHDFKKKYAKSFYNLNKHWIEKYFEMEPQDVRLLGDPVGEIIEKGGDIFIASLNGIGVGTCALLKYSNEVAELARMAVDDLHQGRGIGIKLMKMAIKRARSRGYQSVLLYTNDRLKPAMHIYEKFGFVPIPLKGDNAYSRANVKMELIL